MEAWPSGVWERIEAVARRGEYGGANEDWDHKPTPPPPPPV